MIRDLLTWLPILPKLLRRFARFCDKLALPWRGEIALMEGHPLLGHLESKNEID